MALPFVFRTGGVGVEEIHFDAAGDCSTYYDTKKGTWLQGTKVSSVE